MDDFIENAYRLLTEKMVHDAIYGPRPLAAEAAKFECACCEQTFPRGEEHGPQQIGAFLDDDDYAEWCNECCRRELG